MSYTLKLTNGKLLLTLPDQQSDRVSTSLTLIGKNVNAYGTDINQNYIHILENFANGVAPTAPLVGQMWYDTNSKKIKVYTETNEFKPVGNPTISPTKPITLTVGDFWFDSTAGQLKFQKDSDSLIVIGPVYDASVGKSGWLTETIQDNNNNTQTVANLYVNDSLMGILSNVDFTVNPATTTTSGITDVKSGFNAVDPWWGIADKANYLIDPVTGTPVSTQDLITDTGPIDINNTVTIYSDLSVGSDQDFQFRTTIVGLAHTEANLNIGGYNQNFNLTVNSSVIKPAAIHVNAATNRVGIFNTDPQYDLDVSGTARIQGDLLVEGASTYITTQDLKVVDKTIELASTDNPTDDTASGGGILIKSGVNNDKEIVWFYQPGDNPWTGTPNTWSMTDNLELRDLDAVLYINGSPVLSRETLHSTVKYAPGLTEIGALTSATIGTLKIEQLDQYSTRIGSAISSSTIVIGNVGTTAVDFAGRQLINVGTPAIYNTATYRSSAANVGFVEDYVTIQRSPVMATSIDVTGVDNADTCVAPEIDTFILSQLVYLWDPNDSLTAYKAPNNARARVSITKFASPTLNNVPSNFMDPGLVITVDKGGVQNSAEVMRWSEYLNVTTNIPASPLTVYRCIKEYVVVNGAWEAPNGGGDQNLIWTDGTW